MEWSSCLYWALPLILIAVVIWRRSGKKRDPSLGKPLPGPSIIEGISVFGQGYSDEGLRRLPLRLAEWAEKYGPIMQVDLLVRNVAVINDGNAYRRFVNDAGLRDATNDRPPFFVADYLFGGPTDIGMASWSPEVQEKRRIFHSIVKFFGEGKSQFEQLMLKTLGQLTEKLKTMETVELPVHIKNYIVRVIGALLSGDISDAQEHLDKLVAISDALNTLLLFQNELALQHFPFLRKIPGTSFKAASDEFRTALKNMHIAYYYRMRKSYDRENRKGMIQEMMAMQEDYKEQGNEFQITDETIRALSFDVVVGAYLTTTSTLTGLFQFLIQHQDIQDRVYQEIKTVIGDSEPSFKYQKDMPLTEAVILESLRLSQLAPFLGLHMTNRDITFDGYFIPKKTIFTMNSWHSHHRKDMWEDPMSFKPDRFLDSDGKLLDSSHPIYQHLIAFGSGVRTCPGKTFAKSRMFLFTTFLLQNFQFLPQEGDQNLLKREVTWKRQGILCPDNYMCKLVPRHSK